jgi:hypothetical protein
MDTREDINQFKTKIQDLKKQYESIKSKSEYLFHCSSLSDIISQMLNNDELSPFHSDFRIIDYDIQKKTIDLTMMYERLLYIITFHCDKF